MTTQIDTSQNQMEKTISDGENTVMLKVRYESVWSEWQVRYYFNGKLDRDKSYPASDKEDAMLTMCAMAMGIQADMEKTDNEDKVLIDSLIIQVLFDRYHNLTEGRKQDDIDKAIRAEFERVGLETYKPYVCPLS